MRDILPDLQQADMVRDQRRDRLALNFLSAMLFVFVIGGIIYCRIGGGQ